MNYTTISISDLRVQLPDVAERVALTGEVFAVEKWGKIKGYFVPSLLVTKAKDKEDVLMAKRKKVIDRVGGVWKDREDMKDSVKWVRDLRSREGSRYGKVFD